MEGNPTLTLLSYCDSMFKLLKSVHCLARIDGINMFYAVVLSLLMHGLTSSDPHLFGYMYVYACVHLFVCTCTFVHVEAQVQSLVSFLRNHPS